MNSLIQKIIECADCENGYIAVSKVKEIISNHPTAEGLDDILTALDYEVTGLSRRLCSTSGYIDPERGERMAKLILDLRQALTDYKSGVQGGWLPIDDHCKNGKPFLANNGNGNKYVYIAVYHPENSLEWGERNFLDEDSDFAPAGFYTETSDEELVKPCHPQFYQPLPIPPITTTYRKV